MKALVFERELVEEPVKFGAFGNTPCGELHDFADLEALIEKKACSLNRVPKEPSQQPILRLRLRIFVLQLRTVRGHKTSKFNLCCDLVCGNLLAAHLQNLSDIQLMLKASEKCRLKRDQIDMEVQWISWHLYGLSGSQTMRSRVPK